jgi:hypothetical protein
MLALWTELDRSCRYKYCLRGLQLLLLICGLDLNAFIHCTLASVEPPQSADANWSGCEGCILAS